MGRRDRQAVVVIHGMGEQHPNVTLRSFVESISSYLGAGSGGNRKEGRFWDKPDRFSGNFETRKMTMSGGRYRPMTDFYEFYWAHYMRNTRCSHIKDWLRRIVLRLPQNVSRRLLPVYLFGWMLFLIALCVLIIYLVQYGVQEIALKILAYTSGIGASVILLSLSRFLFNYLGDAGRYLDPSPLNIMERQAIRSSGIRLLKNLHESNKYDRIIIVSHSLGSVIAYDLVKFLWIEYNETFDRDKFVELYLKEGRDIFQKAKSSEKAAKELDRQEQDVHYFQKAQGESLKYLHAIGNRWLISDLVTIGSPLAHAGHLFLQDTGLFEKLKRQREYPTCPPLVQAPDRSYHYASRSFEVDQVNHPLSVRIFNHSSPFAVTRWTNLFFTSDYIGGPLNPLFGNGVRDVKIDGPKPNYLYPSGHTRYWDVKFRHNILKEIWQQLKS